MSSIAISPDLGSFFEEVVTRALRDERVEATDAACHYLVGVLADYAHPERGAEAAFQRPLTFLLQDALAATGAERFRRLRALGDGVLYALGFFEPSVTRHGAGRGYALSVGSAAYNHASAMLRVGHGAAATDVLGELASKYERFVGVVSAVADAVLANERRSCPAGIVSLYTRWLETGSPRLAEELAGLGVVPLRTPGGTN
ncbi:MAG: hypothetical protein IT373_37820 [Polyangiaceae bacterium]|nr:hypothetical protein [Polyangiaceae bacterium]